MIMLTTPPGRSDVSNTLQVGGELGSSGGGGGDQGGGGKAGA